MMNYEPAFSWRNVGVWVMGGRYWSVAILTPWGNVIIKPWSQRCFSERYGKNESLKVFGLAIKWGRLRRPVAEPSANG